MGGKSIKVTEQRCPTCVARLLFSVVSAGVLVLRDVDRPLPFVESTGAVTVTMTVTEDDESPGDEGNDPGMLSCATEHVE